jgi:hypothetical protein
VKPDEGSDMVDQKAKGRGWLKNVPNRRKREEQTNACSKS